MLYSESAQGRLEGALTLLSDSDMGPNTIIKLLDKLPGDRGSSQSLRSRMMSERTPNVGVDALQDENKAAGIVVNFQSARRRHATQDGGGDHNEGLFSVGRDQTPLESDLTASEALIFFLGTTKQGYCRAVPRLAGFG